MKKLFLSVLLILLLAACGGGPGGGPAADTEESSGTDANGEVQLAEQLSVYNWSDYIDEAMITNYEETYGVDVIYDTFASNEDLLAKLQAGAEGYDVIFPSDYMVAIMIDLGLLSEIDTADVPNFANIDPQFVGAPFDPNNDYCVPYQWGTTGIGYRADVEFFQENPPNSWAYVFEPEMLEQYADQGINVLNDPRELPGSALIYLGYDPNTTNPDEIGAARDYLIDRGGNVRSIAQDDGQEKLLSGEVDMVIEYSGDIFQIIANCEANPEQNCAGKYAYVIPAEGGVRWVDNLAIPTDAPHPEFAHAFIDYILDAQVGADISNYTAYATPNQAAIDQELILPEYLESTVIYPDEATNETLFSTIDLGDEVARLYNDAWLELRTLLGQ